MSIKAFVLKVVDSEEELYYNPSAKNKIYRIPFLFETQPKAADTCKTFNEVEYRNHQFEIKCVLVEFPV